VRLDDLTDPRPVILALEPLRLTRAMLHPEIASVSHAAWGGVWP
jgi:hypothetical protein